MTARRIGGWALATAVVWFACGFVFGGFTVAHGLCRSMLAEADQKPARVALFQPRLVTP